MAPLRHGAHEGGKRNNGTTDEERLSQRRQGAKTKNGSDDADEEDGHKKRETTKKTSFVMPGVGFRVPDAKEPRKTMRQTIRTMAHVHEGMR